MRDLAPGEIVIINKDSLRSIQAFPLHERRAFCVFEYVYFARPDSRLNDRSVEAEDLRLSPSFCPPLSGLAPAPKLAGRSAKAALALRAKAVVRSAASLGLPVALRDGR